MSAHPYRQKATAASNTPYPVENFEDAPAAPAVASSNATSDSPYSFHTPLDQAHQLNNSANYTIINQANAGPASSASNLPNSSINYSSNNNNPSRFNNTMTDSTPYTDSSYYGSNPNVQNTIYNDNIKPQQSPSSAPYPLEESSTPPPAFPKDSSVMASPPSNHPLSATSSVTNLNLNNNQSGLDHQLYSKSENYLASNNANGLPAASAGSNASAIAATIGGPPAAPNARYGHTRSVSSASSFVYDRSDNASMVDFSQNIIQQYLGDNSSHLLPRIKTIDMYRKNAKKSNDPTVLFQYAQYMLQTALMLENTPAGGPNHTDGSSPSPAGSRADTPNQSPRRLGADLKKPHSKSKSASSFDFENASESDINDARLRKALLKEALHYLKKLADKGYVEAQYLLADAYSSGALGKIDNKEAFALFQSAAKHGHVECAYRTSYCYEEGLGTGRDSRKAVEYLKMAASKNHPASMYKLGVYSFYTRMGMPNHINTKKMGIKWLTRAANVANELIAAAPFELGKIYYNGFQDIVIADQKYALELYSQAAALGHIEAAAILGKCYEVGDVVPQDSNLSIHYYTQAALGGDPESMLSMCAWYLVGSEPYLPKDESEAFEWAKRAALCGLAKAQFALANFYEKGIGCIKNVNDAQTWYQKAAENGDEKSLSRLTNKEMAAKLQKQMKKKQSSQKLNGALGENKAAQEKDCVIM